MHVEDKPSNESETASYIDNMAGTVDVTDSEHVKTKEWDKVTENGNEPVKKNLNL